MIKVILESPYAGDIDRNVAYAKRAVRDSLSRGEAPIASHLLFTQDGILDDATQMERALGIAAGHAWMRDCDRVVFYADYGMSGGMQAAKDKADFLNIPSDIRWIGTNEEQD